VSAHEPQPRSARTARVPEAARLEISDWRILLCPQSWLGHSTPPEFLGVSGQDVLSVASQFAIDACFADRGTVDADDPKALIRCLLDADVECISHALSALLSMSNQDVEQLVPNGIRSVIGDDGVEFDHIGIEVFGKLEWYIELFDRAYAPLGINVVHEHIFPSVQVRRALEYDEHLGDVRIGRIYFAHGEQQVNLEVFEATQCWQYIAQRQASLYAHLTEPAARGTAFAKLNGNSSAALEPVGHVAFRVSCAEIVESIQSVLLQESRQPDTTMRPYVQHVFFNPADGSTNTKFVTATTLPSGARLDSQIVEIVSYEA
jgi:hypothetical protein